MIDDSRHDAEPHRDPTQWGQLVESLDVASVFVVIASWLGPKLRGAISVEDIWQETLWCSWRDRDQHDWRGLSSWRVWLLSIARNRVRDAGRMWGRTKRGGEHHTTSFSSMLTGHESVSSMLPPGSTTPSRVAGFRERARAMELALLGLDPELRDVVHLRLFEEMPMREVADQLQLSLSTAKERLLRGVTSYRHRLRQILGRDEESAIAP